MSHCVNSAKADGCSLSIEWLSGATTVLTAPTPAMAAKWATWYQPREVQFSADELRSLQQPAKNSLAAIYRACVEAAGPRAVAQELGIGK